MTASNGGSATSGAAKAIGVVADTNVIGNQAVVIHIPASTSNQVANISLTATLTDTGIAFSQSGDVSATGLQGNTGIALVPPVGGAIQAPAQSSPAGTRAAGTAVDLRDTNYALADSGDALAIGVKANTAVSGVQKIVVIIDDNSSGNRIEIVFHVVVANNGTAQARSGQANATGQNGNLQLLTASGQGANLGAAITNTAQSSSGQAVAVGVDATTLVDALQEVDVEVGNNSSNNVIDANFDVDVANSGSATALTGDAAAAALKGGVNVGPAASPTPWLVWTAAQGSVALRNTARGQSGDASSLGVKSSNALNEQQTVARNLGGTQPAVQISYADAVINIGLARSVSGNVSVVAQVVPALPDPATSPTPVSGGTTVPAPSVGTTAGGNAPAASASPSPRAGSGPGFAVAAAPQLSSSSPAGAPPVPQSSQDAGPRSSHHAVPSPPQPTPRAQVLQAQQGNHSVAIAEPAANPSLADHRLQASEAEQLVRYLPWFAWGSRSSDAVGGSSKTQAVNVQPPASERTNDSTYSVSFLILLSLLPGLAALLHKVFRHSR